MTLKKKWPSGRWRQTVNLLVNTHVGSNPTFFNLIYKINKIFSKNNIFCIINRYLKKTVFQKYFKNKSKIRKELKIKFDVMEHFYVKNSYLYSFPYDPFKKNNSELVPYLNYNAYQSNFNFLKRKFLNRKYHKIISNIREKNSTLLIKKTNSFLKTSVHKRNYALDFIFIYNNLIMRSYIEIFYNLSRLKKLRKKSLYYLVLSFPKNRMFINILNFKKKNFLFLSSGLFIKFFEKRKSFKKNKTIKILMAKYLRKIFIMTRLKNLIMVSKSTPTSLVEFLTFLNTPIVHKFNDPLTNEVIEEKQQRLPVIKFLNFLFINNINFSNNKSKSKGRIKRKILRKIVSTNSIVD